MARRKVTTAPVLASWAETDKALRDIRECRHTLAELAVERDRKIDAAKDTYTTTALPVQNRVKELEGQVKAFVDGHRAELVGKSRALNFGVVGYRLSSKLVLPKGRVEDVIAQLKALGRDNLIKRTETLDREALRKEPAELLCKLGAYINQTDEFHRLLQESRQRLNHRNDERLGFSDHIDIGIESFFFIAPHLNGDAGDHIIFLVHLCPP